MKVARLYIIMFVMINLFSIVSQAQNMDTITIEEIKICEPISIKTDNKQTSQVSSYNQKFLNNRNVKDFKDFSSATPTLFIPDYGSKVTSSIYLRGLGSRIDNSSVGLCLDGVMLLNKNAFDFSYFDFARVDIFKGAQSLMFGMNTMAGVIALNTLSPMNYQGFKGSLGYANANTFNISAAYYDKIKKHSAYMVGADYTSTDGYFENKYNNSKVDWAKSLNMRFIWEYSKDNVQAKNSTYVSYIHQGGYPYALFDTLNGTTQEVNYNDFSGYDRLFLMNNTSYNYHNDVYSFQSLTSFQFNFDKLQLDNDFTALDYFNMTQKQHDYAVSQEIIFKDNNKSDKWNWIVGAFAFYKYLDMDAPVKFKKDGIDSLILANANNGIHSAGFNSDIEFKEKEMTVESNFKYPRLGGAAYAQIDYQLKRFNFAFGVRVDCENVGLDYLSQAKINYRWVPYIADWKEILTKFEGKSNKTYLQVLPKFAINYLLKKGNVYASISKGYMTGGYDTAMFADIIRNQMMQDLIADMNIKPKPGSAMEDIYAMYDKDEIINYKPQYIWNYEIGGNVALLNNKLSLSASLFYIDVSNQQITIFLNPQTTGRMMTNAAQSRSFGGEISLTAYIKDFTFVANYGYTNAKFIKYYDGKADYKDKYLTYYPLNTLCVMMDYLLRVDKKYLDNVNFAVTYSGIGDIYYNSTNTIKQSFYNLLSCDITLRRNHYSVSFWARNILNTKYNTFYFLSSGHNFVQMAKPFTFGVTMKISL